MGVDIWRSGVLVDRGAALRDERICSGAVYEIEGQHDDGSGYPVE